MGKTSPYTGTQKKAQRAEAKNRKFKAEEEVKDIKSSRKNKEQARKSLSEINKGKYSAPTDLKALTKEFREADKLAGKLAKEQFKPIQEKAISDYQRYTTPNLASQYSARGSAAKQALKESGEDLQRSLASDFAGMRNSIAGQYMNQLSNNRNQDLNARLQSTNGLMGQPVQGVYGGWQSAYNPKNPSQSQDWGGAISGLAQGGAQAYGAYQGAQALTALAAASSREVKENIVDYDKGLEVIDGLKVMNYDYTMDVPGRKTNRVGLIAEEVPEEIQAQIGDVLAVDMYGLLGVLVNAVKQLNQKVKDLEGKQNA